MDKVSAERQDTSKQYTIEEMKQKIQKEVERKHIIQGSTQRNGAAKLAKHDESPFGMGRSTDWRDTFAWKSPQRSVNEFTLHPIDILRYQ